MGDSVNGEPTDTPKTADSINTLLDVLADDRRRTLLHCLRDAPDETLTIEELVTRLHTQDSGDTNGEEVIVELYHNHLPRLADNGLIEYDSESAVLTYRPHAGLETLLEQIVELELD